MMAIQRLYYRICVAACFLLVVATSGCMPITSTSKDVMDHGSQSVYKSILNKKQKSPEQTRAKIVSDADSQTATDTDLPEDAWRIEAAFMLGRTIRKPPNSYYAAELSMAQHNAMASLQRGLAIDSERRVLGHVEFLMQTSPSMACDLVCIASLLKGLESHPNIITLCPTPSEILCDGIPLLFIAVLVENPDLVRLLITEMKFEPDVIYQELSTPLTASLAIDNLDIAKILIEGGADPLYKPEQGSSPAEVARERGLEEECRKDLVLKMIFDGP